MSGSLIVLLSNQKNKDVPEDPRIYVNTVCLTNNFCCNREPTYEIGFRTLHFPL